MGGPVGDEGLALLAGLTELKYLDVSDGSKCTDNGIVQLRGLKQLEALILQGEFTDKALRHLVKLQALQRIVLTGNVRISVHGQARLAAMPAMQQVSIRQWSSPTISRALRIGDRAPSFTVTTLDGKKVSLDDYRGQVLCLYFYGTWCAPCVANTPKLRELYEELSQLENFAMLSLSFSESELMPRQYVKRFGLTWPHVSVAWASKVVDDYGVKGAPSYFLIGPDGRIISTSGNPDQIKAAVAKALGQPLNGSQVDP